MRNFRFLLASIAFALMLSACTNVAQNESTERKQTLGEEANSASIEKDSSAMTAIKFNTLAYIDNNCTPKYFTKVDDTLGFRTYEKIMTVYNLETLGMAGSYPIVDAQYFLNEDLGTPYYGNFAVRTTYFVSLYHKRLAEIYTQLMDLESSDIKSLRKTFNFFKVFADTSGTKVCQLTKFKLDKDSLSEEDRSKVRIVHDNLVEKWNEFNLWIDSAAESIEREKWLREKEYEELNTATCKEYPSQDGKYVVVKCTVP
jgi:hypothetical protein